MRYWTFYINPVTGYSQVLPTLWKGDRIDLLRKQENRMFKNEMDAKGAMARMKELMQESNEVDA